ncbi:MAG: hypothetical protein K8R85_12370 [Bacteroidetes bacterium]|nr:hypothetical protein [Bacteroidota bacterium]
MKLKNKKIVLFVDLLGFKNLVIKNENEKKKSKKIKTILNIFSEVFLKKMPSDHILGDIGEIKKSISVFSDSVLITIEDKSKEQKYLCGIIVEIASQISECQRKLFKHEILLRGGLTLGTMYHEKDMCFGSALIRAYELESKYAIYPRTLIDNEIIELLKKERGENFSQLEKSFLSKDDTDFYFIDYAKQIKFYQVSENAVAGFSKLNQVKPKTKFSTSKIMNILNEKVKNEKKEDVKMKYIWLRNQFDYSNEQHKTI